jgi:paraquat-inducible protein B
MSENPSQQPPVADAVVRQRSRISFVWIVPIVAVLIGGFLVYRAITERGPMVTITFATASGLEAGKTMVKYKDVEVGRVESIALAEDFSHVEVAVRLGRRASPFMTENTKFWIENARVSAGHVSGLGTLLSGAYIGVDPSDQGERTDRFVGLEEAPIFTSDDAGTRFQLRASSLGSVQIGAPVYFRWIRVGQVVDYALDESGKHVSLDVFVEAPHDDRVGKEMSP